ncbi:MAG: hypothetical protein CMO80_19910 [Verrucomicrobiales bacterium]|nr:hypothetical protein [Verrucomicrobiales bacterium]
MSLTGKSGLDSRIAEAALQQLSGKNLGGINPEPLGWPTSGGAKNDDAPKGTIAVARETLMTYDPTNDRKGGNMLGRKKVPNVPGSSGLQIQVQCGMLLEGYRPTKIVRFYPAVWKFVTIPKEERFFGREYLRGSGCESAQI